MAERSRESELTGEYVLTDQQGAATQKLSDMTGPLTKNDFFPSALILSLIRWCRSVRATSPSTNDQI